MKHDNYRIWSWILAVVLLGTLWHFAYAISGDAYFVGLIAPVNESVWEHLKIVYLPILVISAAQYCLLKNKRVNFWLGILTGTTLAMLIVIFGFYLYSSLLAESLVIDIGLYIASIIVALFTASWITKNTKRSNALEICSIILIIMIGLVLVYATVAPPKISPLLDSNTNTYGIYKLPAD